jgi:uncharacterized protein (DUF58 family)
VILDWLRFGKPPKRRSRPDDGAVHERESSASLDLFDDEFQKQLEYLAIVSRRIVSGRIRAERRSKKTGSGIEFADYRQYSPGDDSRYLDWNVFGRLGRLLLRLYEEEEDLTVFLLLDCSASMGFGDPCKLDYSKRLTAALAYIGLSHLDRVSVVTFRDGIVSRRPPARGKHNIFGIFDLLRPAEAEGRTDMAGTMKSFVAQNKRRGVVVLISDLFDPEGFETGINTLRYANFEPYVVQIVDSKDLSLDLLGDVILQDSENGQTRPVTVTPRLLEQYAFAYRQYLEKVSDFCTAKQVPVFVLNNRSPLADAVLRLLRHGGMVG